MAERLSSKLPKECSDRVTLPAYLSRIVPSLTLMANGKHKNDIVRFKVAMQGEIAHFATRYHKLSQVAFDRSSDQRMTLKDGNRVLDGGDCKSRDRRIPLGKELKNSFEVTKCSFRVGYLRQGSAFGRGAFRL